MSVVIRNTRTLLSAENFRFVGLIYGLTGCGKTTWIGSCDPNEVGVAASETGLGSGLLSIADRGIDHIVPESLEDLEAFCKGKVFPDKKILVLDSISAMARTLIKDAALKIPRKQGESDKRRQGIPELDDYGVIGEMTRKAINILITANPTKHIIVTALEKYDRPNENDAPGTEALIGPDLTGQSFLAVPAMFDCVFRLKVRSKLKNPTDAKSRFQERVLFCQAESGMIAKTRSNVKGLTLLDKEEIFDVNTGHGGFPYILEKILDGYRKASASQVGQAGLVQAA